MHPSVPRGVPRRRRSPGTPESRPSEGPFSHGSRGPQTFSRRPHQPGPSASTISLADARAGDVVVVADILFELVRNRCWDLGIKAGEVFVCRRREGGRIHLEHDVLGPVLVDRESARFVSVERMMAVA